MIAPPECPFEARLVADIAAGRSIDTCPELQEHLAACAGCRELAEVATLLAEDGSAAQGELAVPPAGLVWWRAQLRVRQAAATQAQQAMTVVQAIAAAATVAALAALATLSWRLVGPWMHRLVDSSALLPSSPTPWAMLLVVVGAVWSIAAPVAVYLVLRSERS
jgi:predicted anti-sigma-YlaC factor YlaD